MRVLLAVLDDLFRFALKALFGVVPASEQPVAGLPAPLQPLLPLLPPEKTTLPKKIEIVSGQGNYFISVPEAAVRKDPVAAFDNVVARLEYGNEIKVLKYGGRWAMVQCGDVSGWILKDDISSTATDVFPVFSVGSVYDASNEHTSRLRSYIADQFSATEPMLPLTSAEYVTYRLLQARRVIHWPTQYPRLPGQWQSILRGQTGIHIGIAPRTGAVMEFVPEDTEEGMLMYVEAVFPDESIQVSSIGFAGLGVYAEDVLSKEAWQNLRPVFIEVS